MLVVGLRATGRDASQSLTSASVQARAFGVSRTPGGKPWSSMRRLLAEPKGVDLLPVILQRLAQRRSHAASFVA